MQNHPGADVNPSLLHICGLLRLILGGQVWYIKRYEQQTIAAAKDDL